MTDRQRLERLLASPRPCVWIPTLEEDDALALLRDAAMGLSRDLWVWSVVRGVTEGLLTDPVPVLETEHPAAALYHFSTLSTPSLCVMLDLAGHLADERTLRALRETIVRFDRACRDEGGGSGAPSSLVLIDHRDDLPPVLASAVTRFDLSLPGEAELHDLVKATLRRCHRRTPIDIDVRQRGWEAIVHNLRGLTRRQVESVIAETVADDRRFSPDDLATILARKRQLIRAGGLLEYVDTPADLSGIGGLARLKRWLSHRQLATTQEAHDFGLSSPRGVLLLGVQGAGKSLCAKAIATAFTRPLLRLDPSVLYDRYIGESERRLRDALRQAEMMAPVVLWIDEIEKAFASAAARSIDGGLSQRMFGSLLTWMQEHKAPVFLVATANDIEALPPELLRKGRFDEIFFLDLPGPEARAQIFDIHLRKRGRDPAGFDLGLLADSSDGYSGAEIEAAVLACLHEAFPTKAAIDTPLLLRSLRDSPPLSVTMAEKIAALRAWAEGRCVRAE